MKRINVRYGAEEYSIANRELEDVQTEIAEGIDSGKTFWLTVNDGAGLEQKAVIALSSGVNISLTPIAEVPPEAA